MDLTKILKRLTGKIFEYDEKAKMTLDLERIFGVLLAGTNINESWKDDKCPEGYPQIPTTWTYNKEYLLKALDLLDGEITIITNAQQYAPLILEDDVFQIRIAPRVLEDEEDEFR